MSIFPKFSKLTISDKDLVDGIISRFEPYSDFNFMSMYCWDVDNTAKITILNDNLVIKIPDYLTGETTYSIIGNKLMDKSLKELFTVTDHLRFVPQSVIDSLKAPDLYEIKEDRDHFDYIYQLEDLIKTPGKKYKSLRNKINQSSQIHSDYSLATFDQLSDEKRKEFRKIFREWTTSSEHRKDNDAVIEGRVIDRFFDHAAQHNLICMEIAVNGRSVGFSINEILLNGEYAVCHIQKAIHSYRNIDTILTQYSSQVLFDRGCRFINWEQDLGLIGLRQLKKSYRPANYLKKYIITPV
ncbi:MAG: hypothetical protein JWM00_642 [Candidatus Saccharibacteria bacterium]|nr:hypothetical protein [Candidatus Saccharibacteria bacterium]